MVRPGRVRRGGSAALWLESCGRPWEKAAGAGFSPTGAISFGGSRGAFLLRSDWLDTPTAENTERLGPKRAEGIVLYLPGYDPGRLIQTTRHVPPYLRRMNGAGLDVVGSIAPSTGSGSRATRSISARWRTGTAARATSG